MYKAKTTATPASVPAYVAAIKDENVRKDCRTLIALMKQVTGEKPKMWGPSIIGFGSYHYKYESGHEGDICRIGFSPRKSAFSLYLMGGLKPASSLLTALGKFKTGKGCLYIKRLSDVDITTLTTILSHAYHKHL
jgi:hypothetical protein